MKKVLAGLVSISFLAVLAVPTTVFAVDSCINQACQAPVENVPCMCGGDTKISLDGYYCWGAGNSSDGRSFSRQDYCQTAMSGGSTSRSAGQQQIPGEGQVPSTPGAIVDLIEDIGNWIFTALLAVAAIFLVIAGYRFVFAGGNEENIKKARQMLLNALIGVAVALGAKGLVAVIKNLIEV